MSEPVTSAATAEPGLQDFGWALSTVLRSYLQLAGASVADLPGGPRGYQVLILAAGGTCRSQAALADRLAIDRTIMTYLLDDLERGGLVQRKPDPADRRARLIVVTAKGRRTIAKMGERIADVERHVLGALDDGEAQALRQLLVRAARDSDGAGGLTDACTAAAELNLA